MRRLPPLVLLIAAAVLGSSYAEAAKFPSAVERTFTLRGDAARAAAQWFGLDAKIAGSVTVRLGRGDAWAIYLLKLDTPEALWNDNDGSPPRFETIAYRPSAAPELTLGPFWLDLGTGAPGAQPGAYSFASGFLPAALEGDDAWTAVARRIRSDPAWQANAYPQVRRCVADNEGVELCIALLAQHDYEADVDGHAVQVTIERGGAD